MTFEVNLREQGCIKCRDSAREFQAEEEVYGVSENHKELKKSLEYEAEEGGRNQVRKTYKPC